MENAIQSLLPYNPGIYLQSTGVAIFYKEEISRAVSVIVTGRLKQDLYRVDLYREGRRSQ